MHTTVSQEARASVTEQFAACSCGFTSDVCDFFSPPVGHKDAALTQQHFPPQHYWDRPQEAILILRISPELPSAIVFKFTDTSTGRNSSQMQASRQTAQRNSAQARPSTFRSANISLIKAKRHFQSAAKAPAYNFHIAAHKSVKAL